MKLRQLIVSCLLLLAAQAPTHAGWRKANLGPGGDYCAIAVDAAGLPHVSYLDPSNPRDYVLRHAHFDGKSWRREIVDSGDVGWWSSIAADAQGRLHIAYHADKPYPSLKHAFFDGTSWSTSIVDEGGYSTSIALDSQGQPHICYVGGPGDSEARCARYDGVQWEVEIVAGGALWFGGTSIELGPTGEAHVTFSDASLPRRLYWVTDASGSWEASYVDDGLHGSLALDGAGLPHIAYLAESAGLLRYARYDGQTWTIDTLIEGDYPSLELDTHDRSHLSFALNVAGLSLLSYAFREGANWTGELLIGPNSGTPSSLSLDPLGLPHIVGRKTGSGGGSRLVYLQLRLPDLTGSWQELARTPVPGGEVVTGRLRVTNQGNSGARSSRLQFYLSVDPVLDPADIVLTGPRSVGKTAAGRSRDIAFSQTFPGGVSGRFLLAVIDAGDASREIDDGNNIAAGLIP